MCSKGVANGVGLSIWTRATPCGGEGDWSANLDSQHGAPRSLSQPWQLEFSFPSTLRAEPSVRVWLGSLLTDTAGCSACRFARKRPTLDITPDQMNPNSSEYLAFNTGFPNAFDRSLGRTGSFLMVHGGCRSVGCYAMTDYAMDEIYGLVDEAFKGGQEKVQLQAFPFRMTARNLAGHAGDPNLPFWTMLKAGNDAFLATERPLRVAVCDRRYVFNPAVEGDFDPSAPCPIGIDSTPMAGVRQPFRKISANASEFPPNTRTIADRTADPIAQKIQESLRGIY